MEIPATTTSIDYSGSKMVLAPFDYGASLEQYKVSEREYLREHPEFSAVCTGIVIFNEKGELLLVKRATTERAFPDFWEIPGGKVDEPDESLLHAAVRELKEETGLEATRIVRQVTEMTFTIPRPKGQIDRWMKLIYEMEVKALDVKLEPEEHDDFLFASEEQVESEHAGDVVLRYISPDNKRVMLEAFSRRREGVSL